MVALVRKRVLISTLECSSVWCITFELLGPFGNTCRKVKSSEIVKFPPACGR